jgi:hypothetical protein
MPTVIQLLSYAANRSVAATSPTDCIPLIASNTIALVYSPDDKKCYAYTKIWGYNLLNTNSWFLFLLSLRGF